MRPPVTSKLRTISDGELSGRVALLAEQLRARGETRAAAVLSEAAERLDRSHYAQMEGAQP